MSDLAAARVVSSDEPPHYSALMRPLALVLGVLGVGLLVFGILRLRLIAKLRSGDMDLDYEAIFASFERLDQISQPLLLACWISVAALAFLMWRRLPRGRMASLAMSAFIANALRVCVDAVWWFATLTKSDSIQKVFWEHKSIFVLNLALIVVGTALLVWLLLERSRTGKRRTLVWIALGALAAHAAFAIYRVLSDSPGDTNIWTNYFLSSATYNGAIFIAAWLAWQPSSAEIEGTSLSAHGWAPASHGLRLYERALLWRLILTVGGYVMIFMAAKARSRGMVETLGWALPLMAIVTGAIMTVGVFRFANQPRDSRAGGPAALAGAMMAVALIIDLSLFASILQVLNIDTDSARYGAMADARESLEAAQSMATWGMALSLAAFVSLLTSFHRVAQHFEEAKLAGQAFRVGTTVVLMGSFAWGLRYWMSGAKGVKVDTAIVAALGVLIALLVLVLAYLNLVARLSSLLAHVSSKGPRPEEG